MFQKSVQKITGLAIMAIGMALIPSVSNAQFQGGIGTLEPIDGYQHNRPGNHYEDVYSYDQFDQRTAMRLTRILYRGILFREADGQGLRGYSDLIRQDGIMGLERAAYEMAVSTEYRINVERRYTAEQIVTNLYRVLLGRRPDASGFRYYTQMLRQGRSAEAITEIVGSPEFQNRNF